MRHFKDKLNATGIFLNINIFGWNFDILLNTLNLKLFSVDIKPKTHYYSLTILYLLTLRIEEGW